jgi:hypothetical protein
MKKIGWLRILWLALHIGSKIAEAMNDPETPGQITADELKNIIADAIQYILADLK